MNEIVRALTGTADRPELVFTREYRASPADLREACTDPERLARWFGAVSGDPGAVGDTFTVQLSDDPDDRAEGTVQDCASDAVVVRWSWQGEAPSVITARFAPADGGARLTLAHALAEPRNARGYGGGWEHTLEMLSRALGGAPSATSEEEIESAGVQRWGVMQEHPLDLSVSVPAPLAEVWAAFSTADGLATWWWSHWEGVEIDADVRVGGRYRFAVPAHGIDLHGTYLDVVEQQRIAFTWQWRDTDGEVPDEAVDVRFEPDGESTRVRVRHTGPWADPAPAQSYREGWEFTLGQLVESL